MFRGGSVRYYALGLATAILITGVQSRAAVVGSSLSESAATRASVVSSRVPDIALSYYVPQAGATGAPLEGSDAIRFFHTCPNADGATSFPNNARIKIVVSDVQGPIPGIAGSDICIQLNGGTIAQGYNGEGADSVISNSQWNPAPLCPDLRCISADAPTDANGVTFITFIGADSTNPGVGVRDSNRKWGHYDSELPVYVLGFKLSGRIEAAAPNGTYTLRIKNVDWTGGLSTSLGESVTITDLNGVANSIGVSNAMSFWKDFDSSGSVAAEDLNLITTHLNHNCAYPLNP
jgi:hypothetical protein